MSKLPLCRLLCLYERPQQKANKQWNYSEAAQQKIIYLKTTSMNSIFKLQNLPQIVKKSPLWVQRHSVFWYYSQWSKPSSQRNMSWRYLFFSNWLTIAEMEICHQIAFAEELLLCIFFLHFTHFGKPFSEQNCSFIGTSWLLPVNLF